MNRRDEEEVNYNNVDNPIEEDNEKIVENDTSTPLENSENDTEEEIQNEEPIINKDKNKIKKIGLVSIGVITLGVFGYIGYNNLLSGNDYNVSVTNNSQQTNSDLSLNDNLPVQEINENRTISEIDMQDIPNSGVNSQTNLNSQNINMENYVPEEEYEELLSRVSNLEDMIQSKENIIEDINSRISQFNNTISNYDNRISNIQSEIQNMKGSISLVEEMAEERRQQEIIQEGNVNLNIPEIAEGRERMIGYQVSTATENNSIIVVRTPKDELEVLTIGSDLNYKNKKVSVRDINNEQSVILVGDDYFIDSIKGFGPENNNKKEKSQEKHVNKKSEIKPKVTFIPESQREAIPGWRGVGKMDNGNKIAVDLGEGRGDDRFITLVEGEGVINYGKVTRIANDGTIYLPKNKIIFEK